MPAYNSRCLTMMRITNSMMTANTKANLNTNKANEDRLNTMTASGQKIVRPSDDPVVAIRAMRLNTSLTELDQYYGKNIPDATAWYTDTETALSQTDDVLTSIREKLNQASSEENVTSNVKDILEELKQLKAQFYALGNTDCAGRTVFTGFRTGEMLTFKEQEKLRYVIDEPISIEDLEENDYIKGTTYISKDGKALKPDKSGAEDDSFKQESVQSVKSYRIRLAYDDLKKDGFKAAPSLAYTKADGTAGSITPAVKSITGLSQEDIDKIYSGDEGDCIIPETGEVILSKSSYEDLLKAKDITVTYEKEDWEKGDLRPEHYFKCNTPDVKSPTYKGENGIEYNFNRVDANNNPTTDPSGKITGFKEQELTYEIAYNQTIQINTHANNAYSHDIGRDIDELIKVTEQLANAETKLADVKAAIAEETDEAKLAKLNKTLEAVDKERTLAKDIMHKKYTSAITSFKDYSDDLNKQIASIGALTSRLEMTKTRVKDQQNNVKQLADENINADIAETALDFKNAQLALEAAQLAAGKIANQTLLNYI